MMSGGVQVPLEQDGWNTRLDAAAALNIAGRAFTVTLQQAEDDVVANDQVDCPRVIEVVDAFRVLLSELNGSTGIRRQSARSRQQSRRHHDAGKPDAETWHMNLLIDEKVSRCPAHFGDGA